MLHWNSDNQLRGKMSDSSIKEGVKIESKIFSKTTERFIPYGHQWIDDEDIAAVVEVLKSDWITQGAKVDEFEGKVAEYCGAKYAVAVSSGTAALHAACAVAGITEGDEAITTPRARSKNYYVIIPRQRDYWPGSQRLPCKRVSRKLNNG